jgi:hypothetical protein
MGVHLDANESIFFVTELSHIKSHIWEINYPQMKARQLIPVSMEADPADEDIKYEEYDKTGLATIISDYSKALPRVDVIAKRWSSPIVSIGCSFGYNLQELKRAAKTGKPLDQRRAMAAREAHLREENRLAWFGDANTGLVGLLTAANITPVAIAADGAGSKKSFTKKVPLQILRDLNQIANTPANLTLGIEVADTMLLSKPVYNYIAITPVSSLDPSWTILKAFKENAPDIKEVEWIPELSAFSADGDNSVIADAILVYCKNPLKLTMEVPMDYEMLPPQEEGMEFYVPGYGRFGGVIIYKPLSIAIAKGVM